MNKLYDKIFIVFNIIKIVICRLLTRIFFRMDKYPYVAMLHDIKLKKDNRYDLTVEEFSNYINIIKKQKRNVVNEIEKCKNSKNIVITFDDGYKSIVTDVLPLMLERKIPFIVFVVTDFIGRPGYLSTDDLILLKRSGICKIGSHSKTHQVFRKMSEKEKKFELEYSKKILEKLLGIEITDFAFPYGSLYAVDKRSVYLAQSIYKNVYTTTPLCLFYRGKTIQRLNIPYFLRREFND